MKRVEALQRIYDENPDGLFVISNGLSSREAMYFFPKNNTFYMLHSMGEALSVGIGLASSLNASIVVIEGDGNSLMGLSSWSMNNFNNLKLYILKNETYGTTGYQKIPNIPFCLNFVEIIDIENTHEVTPNPLEASKIYSNFKKYLNEKYIN